MIESLHISNYALIPSLEINFDKGLNIITGETGAGKSIILGALGLVLGDRADLKVMRDPSRKTVVEAVFDVNGQTAINEFLLVNGLDADGAQCILRRELTSKGGSRAFINDTPVTLPVLREMALKLLDIHSQHQNLLLSDHDFQLGVIDALANNADILSEYKKAYSNYRAALGEYKKTADMLKRNKADADYVAFQLEELESMKIKAGEQAELEQRRDILANAGEISMHITDAIEALEAGDGVVRSLGKAADRVGRLDDIFEDAPELAERLAAARIEIQDIVETLGQYASDIKSDPDELEAIEDRLGALYSLQTKHHVDSDEALIELRDKLRTQLDTITNGDEVLADLEEKARRAKKEAVTIARKLTSARKDAAERFCDDLLLRARPLGMANLRCEVMLTQTKLGPEGMDGVEFMFAFNKNQTLMPVGKTASGGEISRVMLALKATVAESFRLPTLIFDEIDTGVSGDIATRMAKMMKNLTSTAQVITITHLPQVAAHGDRHFKVYKRDDDTSTITDIRELETDERRKEIALMLSGDGESDTALAAAESLMNSALR